MTSHGLFFFVLSSFSFCPDVCKLFGKWQICFVKARPTHWNGLCSDTSNGNICVTGAALQCRSRLISQTWQSSYLWLSALGLLFLIHSHTQSNTPTAPTGFSSVIFSSGITPVFQLLTFDSNITECTNSWGAGMAGVLSVPDLQIDAHFLFESLWCKSV